MVVSGHLGGSAIGHLPSAQVAIPGPFEEPASSSAYVSASLSQEHAKILNKKKIQQVQSSSM